MDVALTSSTPSDYGTNPHDDGDPPPTYDEEAMKGVPPSYEAIYRKIREAQANSSTPVHFVVTTIRILLNTVFATVCLTLSTALPIAMIVLGSIYMNDCPAERMIPIYLTVFGAVYNLKAIIDLCSRGIKEKYKNRERSGSDSLEENKLFIGVNWVSRLLGLFLLGFFIAGNVWIYRIYAPSDDPTSPNYCFGPLYYFAFWVTTLAYILIGLCCCGVTTCLLIGCATCYKILKKVRKCIERIRAARGESENSESIEEEQ
ncbi:uncharacterized protein LOC110985928 isoform X2 [Acanthaster planci]|nr:uncharacterized protein LOC110985928 isoform X2 [Acanthaster planci]